MSHLKALVIGAALAKAAWSPLPYDGHLSAGWLQFLDVVSSTCNLRLDTGRLTYTLVDLSEQPRNIDYTRDMYLDLYALQHRRTRNRFVELWNANFTNRTDACSTAQRLWGPGGEQFSGILTPNDQR